VPSSGSVAQASSGETQRTARSAAGRAQPRARALTAPAQASGAAWGSGARAARGDDKIVAGEAPSARHAGRVPITRVSSSTVAAIIARCSRCRPRYRASAPRALKVSLDRDDLARLLKFRLSALGTTAQLRVLSVARVDRLAPARLTKLLQRAVLALLAPVRQVRGAKTLPAKQLTDLTRPGTRVSLGENPRPVLRCKRPSPGLLDQLRVRDPRQRGAPASPEPQLGYAPLIFAAGGSLMPSPGPIRTRLQHLRRSPFSPSRSLIPRW
jgi:hypothetical protein